MSNQKKPFDHPSTSDLNSPNIYKETADLTEKKDAYQASQKKLEPKTYREENLILYGFVKIYKTAFPFISIGLIIVLAYMLTQSPETVEQFGWIGSGLNVIMLVVVLSVFGLVEIVKTHNLSKYFQSLALKWDISKKTRHLAIVASLVSIISSAIGGYILTYQTVDKTDYLNGQYMTDESIVHTDFEENSFIVNQDYNSLIEAKRETKNAYQPPKKYRSLRAKIDNEIEALIKERDQKITDLEEKKNNGISSLKSKLANDLNQSTGKATNLGIILFVIVVILEGANTFSHYFYWQFHVKSVNEGVMFGGIEKPIQRSALEIQFQHFQQHFKRLGGGNGDFFLPSPTQEDERKIGFQQGHHQKRAQDPKFMEEYNRRIAALEKQMKADNKGQITQEDLDKIAEDLRKEIASILGSVRVEKDTEYMYRYFNEEDAAKSREKRKSKAQKAKEEAIRLRGEGMTNAQIAEQLGRHITTIERYFSKG